MDGKGPLTSRRDLLRLAAAMGVASTFVTSLSACGGTTSTTGESAPGSASAGGGASTNGLTGTITGGISYELGTNGYDPLTTTSALTIAANWHTMEGLTELDPATGEVYAALGADLPQKIDDTTYEVALRKGAVFTNGNPVTPDDVVFSFERVQDPKNQSLYLSFIPFLDTVTAKDSNTVTVKLKYPFTLVAERLSVVKIVPKAAVQADAKAFDLDPVGTGPWKMTDNSAKSQTVKFVPNAAYTGSKPAKAASMVWQVIPDDSTRTNALSSSTVQAIDSVPAANLSTLAQTDSVAAPQGFGLLFMMFNCGSAPMNNVKNRQAVLYALDYQKICSVGMSDLATPATCFVQKEHPAYKQASTVYPGHMDMAKKLLAETGLTKVRLLATNHGWFSAVRPMIKESLENAGLQVEYSELQSSDVYSTIDGKPGAFDIVVAPGDPSVFGNDADLLLSWWYSGDTWTDSRMHWKGQSSYQQVQTMLSDGSKATGSAQTTYWHKIFDLVSEVVPLYPIFHRKSPTAWDSKTLSNFTPIPVTGLSFLGTASTKS